VADNTPHYFHTKNTKHPSIFWFGFQPKIPVFSLNVESKTCTTINTGKDVHKYLFAITWTSGCEPSVKIAQDMAADVVSWPWKELLKHYFQHFIWFLQILNRLYTSKW
jgi:hypothetical protein